MGRRTDGKVAGGAAVWRDAKVWASYTKKSLRCWDFVVAAVTAPFAGLLVALRPAAARDSGPLLLSGVAALGVALLAVIVTSIAILSALSANYRFLLSRTTGGMKEAFKPYLFVCMLTGTTTVAALAGLLLQGWGPWQLGIVGAFLLALLAVWSITGTISIAFITARHAMLQGEVDELAADSALTVRRPRGRHEGTHDGEQTDHMAATTS